MQHMLEHLSFFQKCSWMSANDDSSDSSYRAGHLTPFPTRTEASSPGMELPPSRLSSQQQLNETSSEAPEMSTLAVRAPMSLFPSPRDMFWDDRRLQCEAPPRPRSLASPAERIELPSIRQVWFVSLIGGHSVTVLQAIPEIQRSVQTEPDYRIDSGTYSPSRGPQLATAPEYVPSPTLYKRRRLSNDEDQDAEPRKRSLPSYNSPSPPYRSQSVAISPTSAGRRLSTMSTAEPWSLSARSSPYIQARGMQGTRSPPPFDSISITKSDWRPTLPSLPSLTFDREASQAPRPRSNRSEKALDSTRLGAKTYPQVSNSAFDPPSSCSLPPSVHGYQQPRGQSYSGLSTSHHIPQERSPFSNSHHIGYPGGTLPYGLDIAEMGTDSKQRKRRGNLPKDTTDKLRAWFVAHLQHPYPTEDEKQELMRQTGLQISALLPLSSLLQQKANYGF
jgi:hypothetical protein